MNLVGAWVNDPKIGLVFGFHIKYLFASDSQHDPALCQYVQYVMGRVRFNGEYEKTAKNGLPLDGNTPPHIDKFPKWKDDVLRLSDLNGGPYANNTSLPAFDDIDSPGWINRPKPQISNGNTVDLRMRFESVVIDINTMKEVIPRYRWYISVKGTYPDTLKFVPEKPIFHVETY